MTDPLTRRALLHRALLSLAAVASPVLASCGRRSSEPHDGATTARSGAGSTAHSPKLTWDALTFPPSERHPHSQALVLTAGEPGGPMLIALHGRGETRSPSVGARAWRDDYALGRAHTRLGRPPLTKADFEGLVHPDHLRQLNAQLKALPYRGLRVVCPYMPDLTRSDQADVEHFAQFILHQLIPRAGRLSGGRPKPEQTGIAGISLGGRVALLVGLSHPEAFGAVSGLQPALSPSEAPHFADLAFQARQQRPGLLLRLVTSADDPFKPSVEALSTAWAERGLDHHTILTPGPHDYIWNRGPGSVGMLQWFDRALRGQAPTPNIKGATAP
ncbi:MAG: alpha/beta hydrolase-fold protein [Myxococcota bacterium]